MVGLVLALAAVGMGTAQAAFRYSGWGGHTARLTTTVAPVDLTVASDDLGLLSRNWACRSYRDGAPTAAWVSRFRFTSGTGADLVGYRMVRGLPPENVSATGLVAGRCGVAPTKAQLGLS